MANNSKQVISDARKWVEQEKVWDDSIYATTGDKTQEASGHAVIARSGATKQSVLAKTPTDRHGRQTAGDLAMTPDKALALNALYERYKDCTRCALGHSRIKIVFGVGNPDSEVLFIGEGPGYEEDRRGEPFVGKSGQLLDKMMAAIGLSRQTNAYIANIVKCHPMTNPKTPEARGNDRPPAPEEVETCSPILLQQIAILQPRAIMTLGSPSTKMILHTKEAITGLRGKKVPFDVDYFYPEMTSMPELKMDRVTRETLRQTQVLPTFHPAALLRNPNLKKDAWEDLKLLRDTLRGV